MPKVSIRFFNDREVRAVWDEDNSKWFFAAIDIVAVLNEQDDYRKNRNYWKYLKKYLPSHPHARDNVRKIAHILKEGS